MKECVTQFACDCILQELEVLKKDYGTCSAERDTLIEKVRVLKQALEKDVKSIIKAIVDGAVVQPNDDMSAEWIIERAEKILEKIKETFEANEKVDE